MGDERADGEAEFVLRVPEMDCPSCAGTVESVLSGVEGLGGIDPRPAAGTVAVRTDGADLEDAVAAVERAGYAVEAVEAAGERPLDAREGVWRSGRAYKTALSGLFLALGLAALLLADPAVAVLGRELSAADLLLLGAVVAGGETILRNGYRSARALNLGMDVLMSAAILAAVAASLVAGVELYVEAASLAFLFNVAELLERYSVDRARRSIERLVELAPETATVRRDGEVREVPAEEVAVGDVVLVEPGERIPVDGEVVEGASAVDESAVTGESLPAEKAPGDEVYAGSVVEDGYLEVAAAGAGDDTTLARIIELVERAEAGTTEREQFVDRFAGYYTPAVVAVAVVAATVPPLALGAPWEVWFLRGIAFLVIACPCAFVISTPVSVVSAVTGAARRGVLVKGGSHLEALGAVEAVAFDKTGTLTKGELAVTDVVPLGGNDEADVLRCARGVERRSGHPIGEAIVEHAGDAGAGAPEIEAFESLTGRGVRADLDGTTHYAGKPALFEELGFDLRHVHVTTPAETVPEEVRDVCEREGCLDLLEDTIPRLRREGKTVVLVGRREGADGEGAVEALEGVIAVADEVRPDAREAVAALGELGVETVMLTGDSEAAARAVAADLGIDDYRAGLLPGEKVEAVEALRAEGPVAMVGDGVNDAPALAAATVGVAMGAAGTDAAIETADVALMADDLSKLPYLLELARRTGSVVRQNVWSSLGAKAALAVGIPLGLVSVVLAVLAGDVGMTLAVTANAMRLSRLSPPAPAG